MQIYNAMDLKAGKKADYNKMGTLTQPIQFLAEKDPGLGKQVPTSEACSYELCDTIRRYSDPGVSDVRY